MPASPAMKVKIKGSPASSSGLSSLTSTSGTVGTPRRTRRLPWKERLKNQRDMFESQLHLDDDSVLRLELRAPAVLSKDESRLVRKLPPGFARNSALLTVLLGKRETLFQDFCMFLKLSGQRPLHAALSGEPVPLSQRLQKMEGHGQVFSAPWGSGGPGSTGGRRDSKADKFQKPPTKIRVKLQAKEKSRRRDPEDPDPRTELFSLLSQKLDRVVTSVTQPTEPDLHQILDRHLRTFDKMLGSKANVIAYQFGPLDCILHVKILDMQALQDVADFVQSGEFVTRFFRMMGTSYNQKSLRVWASMVDNDYVVARRNVMGHPTGVREKLRAVLPEEEDWSVEEKGRYAVDVDWLITCADFVSGRLSKIPDPITQPTGAAVKFGLITGATREKLRSILGGDTSLLFHRDQDGRSEIRQDRAIRYVRVQLSIITRLDGKDVESSQPWWLSTDVTVEEAVKVAIGWSPQLVQKEWSSQQVYTTGSLMGWWRGVKGNKLKIWKDIDHEKKYSFR